MKSEPRKARDGAACASVPDLGGRVAHDRRRLRVRRYRARRAAAPRRGSRSCGSATAARSTSDPGCRGAAPRRVRVCGATSIPAAISTSGTPIRAIDGGGWIARSRRTRDSTARSCRHREVLGERRAARGSERSRVADSAGPSSRRRSELMAARGGASALARWTSGCRFAALDDAEARAALAAGWRSPDHRIGTSHCAREVDPKTSREKIEHKVHELEQRLQRRPRQVS